MSNLGAYQWITTASKKVGGPQNLLLLTATTGASVYKSAELVVKKCVKLIKAKKRKQDFFEMGSNLYTVTINGESKEGLEFITGEQFKILETDGDAVLIEKIGDKNNPYFVSAELLCTISDYQ